MLNPEDNMERDMPRPIALLAQRASMTCFLNSLLREWFDWTLAELPIILRSKAKLGIRIDLGSKTAWIPVLRYSTLGRHEYSYPAYFEVKDEFRPVDIHTLAEEITAHLPSGEGSALAKARFLTRVNDSIGALAEVMVKRADDFDKLDFMPKTFVASEQHLIVGHSFHPTPKSREGFTRADRYRYGPEYGGSFPLAWFAVDPKIVRQVSSNAFKGVDWVDELMESDATLGNLMDQLRPKDYVLYPMNPWQAKYLQTMETFKKHMENGRIYFLGEFGDAWYPTSSVRAICRPKSPYMLKTSLNVRLTNSVRSLLLKEVDRGIQAHDVFRSPHGQAMLDRYPRFEVLYEPAYWCIENEAGEAIDESIVICRMNLFSLEKAEQGLVLASLTQDNPYGKQSLIGHMLDEVRISRKISARSAGELWFDRYLDIVVEPLLMAQADYGILLGAHQQNILVGFEGNIPSKLYFRDCQGTGYSGFAYDKLKDDVKTLDPANGNILPSEMANILFVYYLFINATFNVITSIAQNGSVDESELIIRLRVKLETLLAQKPHDPSCIEHLLSSETILLKGNFLCSISNINENTISNPLAIYTAITNPLKKAKIQEIFI